MKTEYDEKSAMDGSSSDTEPLLTPTTPTATNGLFAILKNILFFTVLPPSDAS
jgi:hypothetical protein